MHDTLAEESKEQSQILGMPHHAVQAVGGESLLLTGTVELIGDLVTGSSVDPSGALGTRLWRHHFGQVVERHADVLGV